MCAGVFLAELVLRDLKQSQRLCVVTAKCRVERRQWQLMHEAESATVPAYLPKQLEPSPPPTEGGQSLMGLTQRKSAHTYTLTRGGKHS